MKTKYPLSPAAKEAAKIFVSSWNSEFIPQSLELYDASPTRGLKIPFRKPESIEDFIDIPLGIIRELAVYGLVYFGVRTQKSHKDTGIYSIDPSTTYTTQIYELTLLQELRNAVDSDFEVSDYFLTLNAVGTIVYGDLSVHPGGMFQSNGNGSNLINTGFIADEVERLLTPETISQFPSLQQSIVSLSEQDDQETQKTKLGRVALELGRCLDHLSNFGGAIQAIAFIAQFLR